MAKHYSQQDMHRYVWYCVQGILDLDLRSRHVATLSAKKNLSAEQIGTLQSWLDDLDTRRRQKREEQRERARVPPIQYAIAHPTHANLLNLRSGRDQFSRMSLYELRMAAGVQVEIEDSDLSDAEKAASYRWVLRGLTAELATRKIRYGAKLAERRAKSHSSLTLDDEDIQLRELLDQSKEDLIEEKHATEKQSVANPKLSGDPDKNIVTYIAGAKYYDTTRAAVGPLELEWEPTNIHDPNAIKIMQGSSHLGYVPRVITPSILHGSTAQLCSVGPQWKVVITPPLISLPKLLVGLNCEQEVASPYLIRERTRAATEQVLKISGPSGNIA